MTGYQEVTLSNNEVILDIESFRIMKAFIKNKEVYYSLNIKVLENPNLLLDVCVLYPNNIIFNLRLYS